MIYLRNDKNGVRTKLDGISSRYHLYSYVVVPC